MNGTALRPATPGDLDGLEALENTAFASDRLSRRSLRRFIGAARTTDVRVAAQGAVLAGYAMVGYRAGSAAARLFSLAVAPQAARQGIGRALLGACEAAATARGCTRITLEVRADNDAALALYAAERYARLHAVEGYYEDGATAIRFEKRLAPAV